MRRLLILLTLAACPLIHAQQQTIPLWPAGVPSPQVDPAVAGPPKDITTAKDNLVAGKPLAHMTNVANPTLALYPAPAKNNTGAAIVVFPGGGYHILAYDLEGTEVCTWLNNIGVTCVLAQYRVPFKDHFPAEYADLEDAQQAMRLTRLHAAEWHINPNKIGILGFSAGGHLAAVLSNHPGFARPGAAPKGAVDSKISARPDFVVLIYPAYLTVEPAMIVLAPGVDPSGDTPPTFLLMAEDDPVHVENVLVYAHSLKDLKVKSELHTFSEGGHGYGLRPTNLPVTHWPDLVTTWLHTIHVLD